MISSGEVHTAGVRWGFRSNDAQNSSASDLRPVSVDDRIAGLRPDYRGFAPSILTDDRTYLTPMYATAHSPGRAGSARRGAAQARAGGRWA